MTNGRIRRRAPRALRGAYLALALVCALPVVRSQETKAPARHPRDILVPSLPPFAPPLPRRLATEDGGVVLVMRGDGAPVLRATILYDAGTVDEPAGQVGVASVLADVMRHAGSLTQPEPALDAWLTSEGVELSIDVGLETLEVRFACPPDAFTATVERVGAILREPRIDADTLDRARRRIVTRSARKRARPAFIAEWALAVVAYGAESPYARKASRESLRALTVEDVTAFHRQRVLAARATAAVLGEPTEEQLAVLASMLAPSPEPGTGTGADGDEPTAGETDASDATPPPFAGFIQPARTRVWIIDRPHIEHAEVRLAAPGVRRLDPDASELELWSRIVGRGGRTQRLGYRFPDRAVEAGFLHEWNRPGAFLATFSAPVPEVGETLRGMLDVLEHAKSEIAAEDVDRVRRRLMNEELVAADSAEEALARVLQLEYHGYPEDFFRQRVLSWRNTEPEALVEAVGARLDLERMVIVAVGPYARLAEQLADFGSVERLSLERTLAPGANQPDAVQAMFEALGGRDAWADAGAMHAQIDIVLPDREIPSRQWSDLGGPRFRAEYLVASETVTLIVDGERALQIAPTGRTQLDAKAHAAQLDAKRRALWEVLHRMARAADVRVRLDEDRNLTVQDNEGLDIVLELDESHLPVRMVDRTDPGADREFLDWSTDTPLAFPTRIVQPERGLEWRVNTLESAPEFDPLLLEPGD